MFAAIRVGPPLSRRAQTGHLLWAFELVVAGGSTTEGVAQRERRGAGTDDLLDDLHLWTLHPWGSRLHYRTRP